MTAHMSKYEALLRRWEDRAETDDPPRGLLQCIRDLKDTYYGESRVCLIVGCHEPHNARGMCMNHYGQWYWHNKKKVAS